MAATQQQLKQHFLNLGKKGAIYVWGANCQIITKELMDKLYKSFGNSKYNREYYDNKLKEGEGKPGADCSGSLKGISGYDTTASGYYNRCKEKGVIATIPKHKVCLVFKKNSSGGINHVGCYTGDGYVSEMASSKKNYQRKPLEGNGWDLWGMPDFISNPSEELSPVSTGTGTSTGTSGTSNTKGCGYMFEPSTVKKGCKGPSVLLMQTILRGKGYKGKDGKVLKLDGNCGTNSEYAINKYQTDRRKQGVELGTNGKNDSSCGKKMWADLIGL